ncbi:rhamnan synthesis F family protein [Gulosibacter bifidus]|uniref:Rhamnan synthesis F family protein n=1 Tax=Gulosibacter bifidus TaxID=272239 RepID=A0ABW5RJD4_9MICO|nr:rhamnan synthesis F family protein [Gulosibacter bifidus]
MADGVNVRSLFYEGILPQIHWETSARISPSPSRVAVVAQWSLSPIMSKSFAALVNSLFARDYEVLIVSACTDSQPLHFSEPLEGEPAIIRKPNIGYDFGSWAVGFLHQPQIFSAERVLQVNDSLLGPFWNMDPIYDDFERDLGDAWGLVRNYQVTPHLQSYFIGYTADVLQAKVFQKFWTEVRVHADKQEIINNYELGLSRTLYGEGFVQAAYIEPQLLRHSTLNPMISAWLQVLREGVPFLKRELITRPSVGVQGERIPELLRREFDIDIAEWC